MLFICCNILRSLFVVRIKVLFELTYIFNYTSQQDICTVKSILNKVNYFDSCLEILSIAREQWDV